MNSKNIPKLHLRPKGTVLMLYLVASQVTQWSSENYYWHLAVNGLTQLANYGQFVATCESESSLKSLVAMDKHYRQSKTLIMTICRPVSGRLFKRKHWS